MKVIEGHLTANDKKVLNRMIPELLKHGHGYASFKISRVSYTLIQDGENYKFIKVLKDRGLIPCPGSELRTSTYTTIFKA